MPLVCGRLANNPPTVRESWHAFCTFSAPTLQALALGPKPSTPYKPNQTPCQQEGLAQPFGLTVRVAYSGDTVGLKFTVRPRIRWASEELDEQPGIVPPTPHSNFEGSYSIPFPCRHDHIAKISHAYTVNQSHQRCEDSAQAVAISVRYSDGPSAVAQNLKTSIN